MTGNRAVLAVVALASALTGAGAFAAWQARAPGGPARAAMERIVHDYVLAHPEIIPEAMDRLRDRETGEIIAANRHAIFTPYAGAWAGNPKGDVTVVEYFDYNCGYCRASLPTIAKLIAADPGVKVIFRELPILSPKSRTAAQLSLVAAERGKFRAYHDALYRAGPVSDETMGAALRAAGIDAASARAAADAPRIEHELRDNIAMSQRLGVSGTPSWVIGNRLYAAALPLEDLQQAVADARAAKPSS